MVKRESRFMKFMTFSKITMIQNGKRKTEENSKTSGMSTCRPELRVGVTFTELN